MSSERAARQRRAILGGLLFALAWVLAPTRALPPIKNRSHPSRTKPAWFAMALRE
jgi:hypothetical protein